MNRLCDSSDTKLLFRYIQATHHRSQVLQTPRGLLKMQSKLNSFIKVAAPNPIQIKRVSDINADWAKSQSQAMQAHYNDLLGTAKTTIKDRTFTQESFNQAWNGLQSQLALNLNIIFAYEIHKAKKKRRTFTSFIINSSTAETTFCTCSLETFTLLGKYLISDAASK